jgi:hypothetical protein
LAGDVCGADGVLREIERQQRNVIHPLRCAHSLALAIAMRIA